MNDVSSVLGAHGGGETVWALERHWRLSPATKRIQSQFESWLKMRARQDIIDSRGVLADEVYRECLGSIAADIAAGRYAWGGPIMRAALHGDEGVLALALFMLAPNHKDATEAIVQQIADENADGLMAAVMEGLRVGDPKRFPPAATVPTGETTKGGPVTLDG